MKRRASESRTRLNNHESEDTLNTAEQKQTQLVLTLTPEELICINHAGGAAAD